MAPTSTSPASVPPGSPVGDPSPLLLQDLDWADLRAALAEYGVNETVARRVFARVHRAPERGFQDIEGLTTVARLALERTAALPVLEVMERRRADDGFVKYLFRLPDGAQVETVRIPLPDPEDARALKQRRRQGLASGLEALPTGKYVICVSSQVGCALACDFCATGRLGAIRSLRAWEILAQIRQVAAEADHPVRGVVFMGMGEPFLNYDNVVRAAGVLCDPAGFAIAAKSITISTAGVVPMIRRFTAERHQFRLIVSLGAPNSADRLPLMPIEKRWPLPDLMDAVRAYAAFAGGRMTLAYVGIGGVNMSREHARQLVALVAGMRTKISFIDVSDEPERYRPPSEEEIAAFRDELSAAGIPLVRRYSGGREIGAACGTLAATQTGGELVALRR